MTTKKPLNKQPKWKIYLVLTLLIAVGTTAIDFGTMLASYPTEKHREVSRRISELDNKAFGSGDKQDSILESDEYKTLQASNELTYSLRMSMASAVVASVVGIAIVVATYRYLRRNLITRKPVGATVLINTLAAFLVAVPSVYMTQWLTDAAVDPLVILLLLAAAPFAIALGALLTFVIAKITEWHYNRSHGFIED